jgi:hypothetical protein
MLNSCGFRSWENFALCRTNRDFELAWGCPSDQGRDFELASGCRSDKIVIDPTEILKTLSQFLDEYLSTSDSLPYLFGRKRLVVKIANDEPAQSYVGNEAAVLELKRKVDSARQKIQSYMQNSSCPQPPAKPNYHPTPSVSRRMTSSGFFGDSITAKRADGKVIPLKRDELSINIFADAPESKKLRLKIFGDADDKVFKQYEEAMKKNIKLDHEFQEQCKLYNQNFALYQESPFGVEHKAFQKKLMDEIFSSAKDPTPST